MEKCKKCNKKAVVIIDAGETPLCSFHYVEQEDEGCLMARLSEEIDEHNKLMVCKEIQLEIKKQKPKVYKQLESYFDV